jgi:hypothetical protein
MKKLYEKIVARVGMKMVAFALLNFFSSAAVIYFQEFHHGVAFSGRAYLISSSVLLGVVLLLAWGNRKNIADKQMFGRDDREKLP